MFSHRKLVEGISPAFQQHFYGGMLGGPFSNVEPFSKSPLSSTADKIPPTYRRDFVCGLTPHNYVRLSDGGEDENLETGLDGR